MNKLAGSLYIVATPIGNLDDISQRAIETLERVSMIAVEDTRHSGRLLDRLGIKSKLILLHDHNEQDKAEQILDILNKGENVALISDAGTPLISDPGYHLVSACHQAQIKVIPIPGPAAVMTALSVSGLPSDRFVFEGFLPVRSQARKDRLQKLTNEVRTMIFYEAPHRIKSFIDDACEIFGNDHQATVARELTKIHEEIIRGSLNELKRKLDDGTLKDKGEFVVLLQGCEAKSQSDNDVIKMLTLLHTKLSLKDAVTMVTSITGRHKNDVYQLAINNLQHNDEK